MPHIVLASGSPRRAELLRRIGITEFDIVRPEADETYPAGLTPEETVAHIARAKAKAAEALTAPGDVVITAGGSEAITFTMECILDDGDEIIIPEPFYPNYKTFIYNTGADIVPIKTSAEEGYRFATREKIEAAITPNTRAIMFTNPGNPTGVVLTPEERRLVADIAKEHDLWIIADEVYREFTRSEEHTSELQSR